MERTSEKHNDPWRFEPGDTAWYSDLCPWTKCTVVARIEVEPEYLRVYQVRLDSGPTFWTTSPPLRKDDPYVDHETSTVEGAAGFERMRSGN